jgi:hypothetical protein
MGNVLQISTYNYPDAETHVHLVLFSVFVFRVQNKIQITEKPNPIKNAGSMEDILHKDKRTRGAEYVPNHMLNRLK